MVKSNEIAQFCTFSALLLKNHTDETQSSAILTKFYLYQCHGADSKMPIWRISSAARVEGSKQGCRDFVSGLSVFWESLSWCTRRGKFG